VPLEHLERLQWQRLKLLLEHAAKNIPYYCDVFGKQDISVQDIRCAADLRRLPILAKKDLQHNAQALLAKGIPANKIRSNATGGSTGTPVQFFQDGSYWAWAKASQRFVESWWGIRAGDRTAAIWGCDRDLSQQSWKERLHSALQQMRTCNAFALTPAEMHQFAAMLASWQPRFVIGYASALEVFATFLALRPDLHIRPHAVKSTAEMLTERQRETIEKAFKAPVFNFYGSREINNLAAECALRKGLHINSFCRFVEIVDDAGRPVEAGTPGRIVVTDLTNFAMPFIRYETGDLGVWADRPCPCGRPFPLLAELLGRKSDFIVAPSGKLIHGEFFTHLFYDAPQVANFRVNQIELDRLQVHIVLRAGVTAYDSTAIRQRITRAMGDGVTCEVIVVDSVERTASGKHRFTVSNVPVNWDFGRSGSAKEKMVRGNGD
jgi:phenylacetate-CoA ligase